MTGFLFDIPEISTPDIPGLSYIPDFITADEERALIEIIDQQPLAQGSQAPGAALRV